MPQTKLAKFMYNFKKKEILRTKLKWKTATHFR